MCISLKCNLHGVSNFTAGSTVDIFNLKFNKKKTSGCQHIKPVVLLHIFDIQASNSLL